MGQVRGPEACHRSPCAALAVASSLGTHPARLRSYAFASASLDPRVCLHAACVFACARARLCHACMRMSYTLAWNTQHTHNMANVVCGHVAWYLPALALCNHQFRASVKKHIGAFRTPMHTCMCGDGTSGAMHRMEHPTHTCIAHSTHTAWPM